MQAVLMLRTVTWPDVRLLLLGAGATFLRVNASLLISALWTVPVGVAIGFNPRLARVVQPLAQVLASVPASAFYPVLLIGLIKIGGGLGIGSMALMLLGTQWYILFNVIAGAMSIPSDLREVARFSASPAGSAGQADSPRHLPLPDTGMVTASGGAWNASVMAEYSQVRGRLCRRLDWARRSVGNQCWALSDYPAGDHLHLADGGDDEQAGLAEALPVGGNAV